MGDGTSWRNRPASPSGSSPRPYTARLAMVLEALIAVTAIPAGIMLAVRPDGALIGMPLEVLEGSPFRSFLAPGLILALVVGGFAAAAFSAVLLRQRLDRLSVLASGLVMTGWIAIQILMLGYLSALQPFFLLVGLALCVLPWCGRGWTSEAAP